MILPWYIIHDRMGIIWWCEKGGGGKGGGGGGGGIGILQILRGFGDGFAFLHLRHLR